MHEIVLLADRYLPHAGGSRVYYHALYSRLARSGEHRIRILTTETPGSSRFDLRNSDTQIEIVRAGHSVPDLRYRFWPRVIRSANRLVREVSRIGPCALHCGDLLPQGLAALSLKRRSGLPYLAYCHGEEIPLTQGRRVQEHLRNRVYRSADHIIAACEYARQCLLGIGIPESRITKILPGVDLERFQPCSRRGDLLARYGIKSGPILLTVARLTPRKGHLAVLRAFAKIRKSIPDATYLIAGTGPERQALESEASRLGVAGAVRFTGHVAEEDVAGLYQSADLFVMMNREIAGDVEGFGMVFLEASACGKPVLGGRSGGTAESIADGETGFRLDPDDERLLVFRLQQLLLNPAMRQRMGDAGLRFAREGFRWESRVSELKRISAAVSRATLPSAIPVDAARSGALL